MHNACIYMNFILVKKKTQTNTGGRVVRECGIDSCSGANGEEPFCNAGDARDSGLIPGQEGPWEEGMATHSSILAWRIPLTEEPGRL